MINFGDVIKYKEGLYVYFVTIGELVYLAKILDYEISKQFINAYKAAENKSQKGSFNAQKKLSDIAYCFVVLTTKEFRERVAYCYNHTADVENFNPNTESPQLNEKDIQKIKDEIRNNNNYPRELKNYIEKLG